MKNTHLWAPTKFESINGRLRGSRDPELLSVGSRLVADAVATLYQDAFPRYARGRLVDLGCGRAPFYAAYRPFVDTVTCVDWPQGTHGEDFLDITCDLSNPLPFHDSQFDTILLSDVLEHLPEPLKLWQEMARIISPGGHVLLNVPFLFWLHEIPHDYYRFTEFALRRFAERTGFELLTLDPVGGSLDVAADYSAKHLIRIPLIGPTLAAAIQTVVSGFARSQLGRRVRTRTAARFPLGYFLVARRRSE